MSMSFKNDAAVDDRSLHLHGADCDGIDRENIAREDDEVGELARCNRAFHLVSEFGVSRTNRVGAHRFVDGNFLLGNPALWMFAVEGATCDGGEDALHGIERGDGPVGAEGEPGAGVEQRAEGIRALAALLANALFGPATIIRGMIRLHRGDNACTTKTWDVLRAQVLRMFDAEPMIARAV